MANKVLKSLSITGVFSCRLAVLLCTTVCWPVAVLAQQYTAGAGQNISIPPGTSASVATGSAIIATGGGIITGTDISVSSGDTGTTPVVLSSGAGSSITLSGATVITGNGTGVRLDNGGQVSLSSGTVINLNGSNSGSAGIIVNNTTVDAGAMAAGITINFNAESPHIGSNAWVGVSLAAASSASFDNLTVSGNSGILGFAASDGSSLTLTNSAFTTNVVSADAYGNIWPIGVNAFGFSGIGGGYIVGQNTVVNASNTSFTVNSPNGIGAWGILLHGGTFNGDRVTFIVGGQSRGIDQQGTSRVNLVDSSLTMTDSGGIGALIGENSVLTATRTTFTAPGGSSAILQAQSDGSIFLTDSTVDAGDAGTFAVRLGNTTGVVPGSATIVVSGGTVTAAGTAIRATSSDARATLQNGATVTGGNGILLDVTSTGFATLIGDTGAVLNGDMQAAVLNSATVTLSNGVAWTGAARNIGATAITDSTWTMTGNSDVASLVLTDSTVAFKAPVGDPSAAASYKTLTVRGDYSGNNGVIILNTFLGNDSAPTDRLVVQGDTSGSSLLKVVNNRGPGLLTTGDGIMVVNVQGASNGVFMLAGRVVSAGRYEYLLFQGGNAATGGDPNDGNWYLRDTFIPAPTPDNPTPEPVPIIRPEVPVSMVIPPLAIEYGYAMLDTLHERVGETWLHTAGPVTEERVVYCKDPKTGFRCVVRVPTASANGAGKDETRWAHSGWARLIGNRGFHEPDNFMRRGPNYDYTFGAIQAGLDIFAREQADGTLDKVGIYMGYGQITSNVKGQFGGKAGTVDMDAYTLGGYWTHHSPSGWFTDAVIQGTWYAADAKSIYNQRIKPDGFGILGSLEAGYAFKFGSGWTLEPQAQIVYQNVSFDHTRDGYGFVRFDDGDSLRGRLGLRLTKSWNTAEAGESPRRVTAFLRGNVWHEFLGKTRTSVGSLDGVAMTPFNSYLGGTWGEIGVGVTAQVSDAINLFATSSYNHSLDNKGHQSWDGRLGMTVKW